MAQSNIDPPRYSQDQPATAMTEPTADGAGMHPDMMNAGIPDTAHADGATGIHHGRHGLHDHGGGARDYYDDAYDNTTNDRHHIKHHHRHGPLAKLGLGATAGGIAGAAAGKHMHNHKYNNKHSHRHNYNHNRGGTIGRGTAMDSATLQMEAEQMMAEEHNNFPGTNPHPAHSALSTRGHGHGLAFPGRGSGGQFDK